MKNLIYLFILALLITSCNGDEWLDIKPKGKVIPNKVDDYRLLLDQTQNLGKSEAIFSTTGGDLFLTDDVVIGEYIFDNSYGENSRNAYTFEAHTYLEIEEDDDWQVSYNQIYVSNVVIEEVLETSGKQSEKEALYAEAKVHRAYAYLNLVNLYSKHYNDATAGADLGVPMRLDGAIEGNLKRGTVQEVYDLILSDLKEVYDYLPDVPEFSFRPSKAAVNALLARTYLLMGDFDKALVNANKSLDIYSFMYNYNDFGKNAWYSTALDMPDFYENKEQILLKQPQNKYQLIYPSEALSNLYDKTNDWRYDGMMYAEWFPPYTNMMFLQEYMVGRSSGLSVPEMLLIRAECHARAGAADLAMDDINTIRQNRIKTAAYLPLTAAGVTEALQLVKEERRRELAFLGARWFDIKRYNTYDNANISIDHSINDESHVLAPGDNKWVLPIARKYILKNSEIEQNPR
ncbi:RagB/SusD family nutrient uptake outer membrane protein [Ancylomarina euxinus]|uniref:RagB/SusD family nutrient uptake outer membrane protein n=1 Tax=Ancylomarina euxinus TaxID=2283627 RepID=A0A425XZ96_9BACT|nr:RagB/SusD family nutrient uptake outer membrane protein [Ancylomarina euxinus]MCZ4695603.1 RagB/SusD family nutrient uptake outer membrane protein [Ancylomarina euxinus]MUP15984.1 RagB/SusD family nutrient uptake outer membrane protein [Ancylomarina euxinus]RRG20426.1 RagB/SusD family nutrient uptake outer membrane protein [Ancylomarina euxinus]